MSRFQNWENKSQDKLLSNFMEVPVVTVPAPAPASEITDVARVPAPVQPGVPPATETVSIQRARINDISSYANNKRKWENKKIGKLLQDYDQEKKDDKDYVPFFSVSDCSAEDENQNADKVMADALNSKLDIAVEKPAVVTPTLKSYLSKMKKIRDDRESERANIKKTIIADLSKRNADQKDGTTAFNFEDDESDPIVDEFMDHTLYMKLGIDPITAASKELLEYKKNNIKKIDKELDKLNEARIKDSISIGKSIKKYDSGKDVTRRFGYEEPGADSMIIRFD